MAESLPPVATADQAWPTREMRTLLATLTGEKEFPEVRKAFVDLFGSAMGGFLSSHVAKDKQFKAGIAEAFKEALSLSAEGIAAVVNNLMGIPLPAATVAKIGEGTLTPKEEEELGGAFVDEVFRIFDIAAVREGYASRLPGPAENANFRRFVGANLRLQLGGLIGDAVASASPWKLGNWAPAIADRVEKTLGYEDAQEEILEPFMEKLIVEGLNKFYNRETKPVDFSVIRAIDAFIQGRIGIQTFNAILDNEGVRQDIRQMMVEMQGKNLSASEMQERYYHGKEDQDSLLEFFRSEGYLHDDAIKKVDTVINDRRWKLQAELTQVKEAQFVKGVLDETNFRTWLQSQGYDAFEEDLEIEIGKAKATLAGGARAKGITGSFNIAPTQVKEGATAIISWNIRNADEINISELGQVPPRGEQPLLVTESKTYTLTAKNANETEEFVAYVGIKGKPEVKRPVVSLSLSPRTGDIGSLRELRWRVTGAESATLDGVPVDPQQGVEFVLPVLPTFYTLIATNEAGTTVAKDVALVRLPEIAVEDALKPKIAFAITPGVIKIYPPKAELKWGTTSADRQWIIDPAGVETEVPAHGAIIIEPAESGVYTLRAENEHGRVERQEAVIVY